MCPFATAAALGLPGCAPSQNVGLGDDRAVLETNSPPVRLGRSSPQPQPARRTPGTALLALAALSSDCALALVSACDPLGFLRLAGGSASLRGPGYHRLAPLCTDPGLARLWQASDPLGLASNAPPEHNGGL